ncbi:MAG: zinc-binding dehydrogenase, partial [Caldilineaceae bacterium]|nr:zinc-binding dehydrogenase [Caldilineaceae bacterium]
ASLNPMFEPGQRVVVAPYVPCLHCTSCRRGHYSLCDRLFEAFPEPGGFTEMLRVPSRIVEQGVLTVPDHLDDATASLTEPLACCLHGLEAIHVQAGESLLIIGDGPMGLLQAMLGKQLGAAPIILSGMAPHRLDFARQIADVVVNSRTDDLGAAVNEATGGGVDKIVVSVASEEAVHGAMPFLRKGGAINLFAGMPQDAAVTVSSSRIHYDELTVLGTFGFWPVHFRRALELLSSKDFLCPGFVTTTVTLDNMREALEAAGRYEGIKAVMLRDPAP